MALPTTVKIAPLLETSGHVVAFVGSAGSIEALRTILSALAPLNAPMIVLVHQSPDRPPDALSTALGHPEGLAVHEAQDGWLLRPGRVYVVPAGSHMLIHPGRRIQIFPAGSFPPYRPSADLLLVSMAITLGPETICVVLSGAGTDGATGATAVHHNGGTVITTDSETSRAFSMPRATIERDGIAPRVVAVDEVAPLLLDLIGSSPSE